MNPEIQWLESRCIGCRTCVNLCPEKALSFTEEGIQITRELCTNCGVCSEECPSTAMELLGTRWNLDDLVGEVKKDRVYFEKSGGGITASGGEPALQADFVAAFFKKLKETGIHTALDTCGFYAQKALDKILPHSDLILYDVKEIDPVKHNNFTGSSNELILNNLIYICEYMKTHDNPCDLWIRTPVIPGATETEENIAGIGTFIATRLKGRVAKWELCSFNNLCMDKYRRLGLNWSFKESPLLTKSRMEELTDIARNSGVDQDIVCWSGPVELEKDNTESRDHEGKPKIIRSCSVAF